MQPEIQIMSVDAVIPYEDNAKIHDEKQVEKIATAIKTFGWDQPIVVDKSGVIIKGHGRRLAAIKLGMKNVPVIVRDDLNPEQVKAARLSDNRVAVGDIDIELLQKELLTLSELDIDLGAMGFDDIDLDFMMTDDNDLDGLLEQQSSGASSGTGDQSDQKMPKADTYVESFQVVIECEGEADQEKIYHEMSEKGYKCRLLSI